MKKNTLKLALLLGFSTIAYSQVGIGTSSPDPSSILELNSPNQGLLLSRVALTDVTLAAPLAAHVQGMVVYNTNATITGYTGNAEGIWRNDGTQWRRGTGSGAGGTDLIGQTSGIVSAPAGLGSEETWLGEQAGSGAGKKQSVLIGYQAGKDNTNAGLTAVGYAAGNNFANGSGVVIGAFSGQDALNTSDVVFVGRESGQNATNATFSTFIGQQAGKNTSAASNSIFIGNHAGLDDTVDNNATNSHSILIGDNTSTSGFKNSVAIGYGAYNKAENEFLIGSYEGNPATATQYDIVNPKYPDTRDDSGVTTPVNFLYTDAAGKILSAPTSALGGGSSLQLYSENPVAATPASATGTNSVAIGDSTVVANDLSAAVGKNNNLPSGQARPTHAFGYGNTVAASWAFAAGSNNSVSGSTSYAFGYNNTISSAKTYVVGEQITASQANTIILGSNTVPLNVGVGTTTPFTKLQITSENVGGSRGVAILQHDNDPTNASRIVLAKSRGTEAAQTAVLANDAIGKVTFNAHNGTTYIGAAAIQAGTTVDHTAVNASAYIDFITTPVGSILSFTRMRISEDGNVGIGTTLPTSKLHVNGLPGFATDAAAGVAGLTAGAFYQTSGHATLPNGVVMVKQ